MSAQEIIEQIKALPPEEQRQIAEYINGKNGGHASDGDAELMRKAKFEVALESVFSKHDELFRKLAE